MLYCDDSMLFPRGCDSDCYLLVGLGMKKSRTRTIIERLKIVDHVSNRQEVLSQLHAEGFRVTASGPYTSQRTFPRVHPDWFILTAEREKNNESES